MEPKADYLFEASWEVCNKVGGIYTVVKSKLKAMQKHYNNYFLIGPYFEEKTEDDFQEEQPPDFLEKAFKEMEDMGVKCHYGTWKVEQEPKVILIDFEKIEENPDNIKKWLWDNYEVDSLEASWDFEQPMIWSWTAGILMEKINAYLGKMEIVMHCHEWMTGFAILYLDKHAPDIHTVFTTHATMLGRTIAGNGYDLYDMVDDMNPMEEAKRFGVEEKFTAERACTHTADVFTTVSEITALEARKILGRNPDVLLNNGLNVEKYPTIEETTLMHVRNRDAVREFLAYYFFPYYCFPLEHNLIYFIVGRYEYKNKGIDVFINALGRLNEELKEQDTERTITVFFWVPMSEKGVKEEVKENKRYYNKIKDTLEDNSDDMIENILHDLVSKKCSMEESIFTSQYVEELKDELKDFHREGKPPIATHDLVDKDDNNVLNALREAGLTNEADDKVKAIVYPVYLDGDDGLLNLGYHEALSAGHLGVLPSYYEPWGYTPVESMSLGVPAVTTDLAGFGRFIKPKALDENPGVFVLERFNKNNEEVINGLYNILSDFAGKDHAERVQNKINAKQMSILTDWKHFVKNYIEAHNKALER